MRRRIAHALARLIQTDAWSDFMVPTPLYIYLGNRTYDYLFGLAERCDDIVRNTKTRADNFRGRKCEPLNLR